MGGTEQPKSGRAWADVPEARRATMRANRRKDTRPEMLLRSALHAMGLRFRVDYPLRPSSGGRPIRPDVVFPRRRVAVFVDGCFWHACPVHGSRPASNRDYWDAKLDANRERDARSTAALAADGWTVLRFWEHDDPLSAAREIKRSVRGGRSEAR